MKNFKHTLGQIFSVYIGAFLLVFMFGLMAHAQMPDGELEISLNNLIDAFKVGQVGAIIMAVIAFLRTRFMTTVILSIAARFGLQKPAETVVEEKPVDELAAQGYEVMDLGKEPAKISGAVIPASTVLLGAAAGLAESLATGKPAKQAIFEGLLSSGVSMALYDLALKPLLKKFSKKK